MKLKLFIIAMCLGLALPATADYLTIEQAYEVALSDIRLPRSESGTIAYKECQSCEIRTTRVDENTQWLVNGKAVSLKKFREAVSNVVDRDTEAVTVRRHLEKDRVTAVSVYL
jgi:biopolymer transport protein ExbD